MKRFNFIAVGILLVVLTTEYVQSQTLRDRFLPQLNPQGTLDSGFTSWQWLNPLPQGNALWDVQIIDTSNIVAIGNLNTFSKSTNGGRTWGVQYSIGGTSNGLYAVSFINEKNGVVAGTGLIIKTTNGGLSWSNLTPSSGSYSGLPYYDIVVVDSQTYIAVGALGSVLRTTDAGNNWEIQNLGTYRNLLGIGFSTKELGIIVGSGGFIFRTMDGGLHWNRIDHPFQQDGYDLFGIDFGDDSVVTVVGREGRILRSNDGGLTWVEQRSKSTDWLLDYSSINAEVGVAVGFRPDSGTAINSGLILRTSDGGVTWQEKSVDDQGLFGVFISTEGLGIVVGFGGVCYQSKNAGNTWERITVGTTQDLHAVCIPDMYITTAVGDRGTILRTTNAGLNWLEQQSGITNTLYDVSFVGPNEGITVGAHSTILITEDGGINWFPKNPSILNTSEEFRGVSLVDTTRSFVVGSLGSILKTKDAGGNWEYDSIYNAAFYDVSFSDTSNGIIVGYDRSLGQGLVLFTHDGGETWSRNVIDFCQRLLCIWHVDPFIAFASGWDGIIIRTTDGGATWLQQNTGILQEISNVSFIDANIGMAVGGHGVILRTINGGLSWTPCNGQAENNLSGIALTHNGYTTMAYAVGRGGNILVSAISPLSPKIWLWTGIADSSWHNPNNWSPEGIPLPGDSVIIPPSPHSPIIDSVQQQVVIASLNILSGGKLKITDVLPRFVVLADVTVYGTLEIRPPAATTIIVGGNWTIEPGGSCERFSYLSKSSSNPLSDEGFVPSHSTVLFSGSGTMAGSFFNLMFDTTSSMKSNGNVSIQNQCTMIGDVNLGANDTVFVQASFAQALVGPGKFTQGTVKRTIESSSIEPYGFESNNSYVQFDGSGIYPSTVAITTLADTNPTKFGNRWVVVQSHVDPVANVITADSVTGFSKWVFGIPRPTEIEGEFYISGIDDTIPLIRRVYDINADGGSEFKARLALRYDQSEVPEGIQEDSLKLLRLEGTVDVKEQIKELPKQFSLGQNYPNPFNPITTIRYELPSASFVTLRVYNLLGQEVATLVNEKKDVGRYDVAFSANKLTSGVYFYRLQSGDFIDIKKLILIK